MAYNNITSNLENNILTIYIDRPEKLNALNKETLDELSDLLIKTKEDNEAMVLVITGSGNKSFVAGADISEFAHYDQDKGKALSAEGHDKVFNIIENYPKPVIAAVNGFALGGGLELAMACHIRVASFNAKMGLPEVSLGIIPGYGGTQRLAQLVGKGKALEMIMTTNMLTAEEGLSFGLVNQICEQDVLLDTTYKLAGRILKNSPHAISCAIKAVNALYKDGEDGLKREIEEFGNCFGTPEFIEGTSAFMEKRKANFKSVRS